MGKELGRTTAHGHARAPWTLATSSAAGEERPTTRPRSASLFLLALVAAAGRARAAEEEPLGEVVVEAPPLAEETPGEDPTAFATVIDTRAAPTRVETLAEALADVAGVAVRRFGGLGDFSTVSVRGYGAGQVQVYLDGVPLARADNETVNLGDLPLDAIERVEVYRGTTPLGFAQSGPGGVVNVVTRRPGVTPLSAASVSYGSFATRKVDAVRAERAGPWEYLAFAHYLGSAGDFEYTNDRATENPADDRIERRQNNDFNQGDVTARVGWRPGGPWRAALTSDTFAREGGVPGLGVAQAENTRLRAFRQLAHLDLDLDPPGTLPLTARGGAWVVYERQRFEDPDGEILVPSDTQNRSTAAGGQVLLRGALGAHQVPGLLVAASHEAFAERDRLDPAPPPPNRTRVHGTIAAEDEVLLAAEHLAIVPGFRWEVFRDDFPGSPGGPPTTGPAGVQVESFTSPRLGVRVRPLARLTLLGNVGRYERVPNLTELFGDSGVLIGNPDLRPEVALNADVGFRAALPAWGPLAGAGLEFAWFDNSIDDLIVLVQQSQRIVRPENVTQARIRGIEVAGRARLWSRIGLVANYTHQDARDDGDVPSLQGKRLPGRPAHEGYAQIEYTWSPERPPPLPAGVGERFWPGRIFYEANVIAGNFLNRANTERVGSRAYQDLGLEVALPLAGLRATFEVKNLGDDQTSDALGFPLPGRAFFATLAWGFGREETDARP